jgi:eukaryotic-like serine/threonine-protein kinase
MDILPDSTLNNRYRIIRQLGKGGMGAVYLAYDIALEHEVALKTNLQSSEHGSQQFLREARLLARLRHSNLPRVIDYFIIDNDQLLVMDYIAGSDLRDLLKIQGPQPLDKVLSWATQLGSALSYLHRQDPPVVHRDIKPANIKLTLEGEVILVDFGIAKATDNTQQTATGAYGYTPGYAPPEQYGSARTGPYSDQFSLAATIYALLTNHMPTDALQRALGEAVLTPLAILRPDTPKHVQDALERGMAIKPEDRFANVDDFIAALTHAMPTQQVQITPQVQPVLLQASQPQDATLIRSASSAVAIPATPTPQPRKQGSNLRWILPVAGILVVLVVAAVALFVGINLLSPKATPAPAPVATKPVSIVSPIPAAQAVIPTSITIQFTATPVPPTPTQAAAQSTATSIPEAAANFLGAGKLVAFISDRGDSKTHQIWTMKVSMDTSNTIKAEDLKQLTIDSGNKQDPSWSPDGKWLFYSAPGPAGDGLDIWKIDTTTPGSQPLRLTNFKGDDIQPAMSPDGKTIAFTNFGRFNAVNQIYFMDPDGSKVQRISTDFSESQPIWSPDMQWLVYVINASSHNYLFMYNLNDRDKTLKPTPYPTPQRYDNVEMFGRLGEVSDPAWSADGTYLAYTRTEGYTHRIYSVNFKSRGGQIALLTQGAFKESKPTWAPDGQWLCYTSERDNNAEIYLMTNTGLLQTNLSNSPGFDAEPAWQP